MMAANDARVPVCLGQADQAGAEDALLIEGGASVSHAGGVARFVLPTGFAHRIGCACCLARGPAATALGKLFLQRARGEIPFFRRVIAVPASQTGKAAIGDALQTDILVRARYRSA